eukprot:TRINITY_DN61568_c0_g1_i1.p1 TRINITY_DN61568_c0_g1~~TRINITY_DN61568_c0_g1_i1.p1  ORF type:complete len:256 (-),score=27.07 TRINITY_DN61568_c0_g1_i1:638-1405(-)
MAAFLNFLDIRPPEDEPAPEGSPGNGRVQLQSQNAQQPALATTAGGFLPILSTEGLAEDSDSEDGLPLEGYKKEPRDLLSVACEPPPDGLSRGLPTHVILRVLQIQGIPLNNAEIGHRSAPGRRGLGYFLDNSDPMANSRATVAVLPLRSDGRQPPRKRRHAEPTAPLRVIPGGQQGQLYGDVVWDRDSVGEVRARLEDGQGWVQAAVLIGQEVMAVTAPVDLSGVCVGSSQNTSFTDLAREVPLSVYCPPPAFI